MIPGNCYIDAWHDGRHETAVDDRTRQETARLVISGGHATTAARAADILWY